MENNDNPHIPADFYFDGKWLYHLYTRASGTKKKIQLYTWVEVVAAVNTGNARKQAIWLRYVNPDDTYQADMPLRLLCHPTECCAWLLDHASWSGLHPCMIRASIRTQAHLATRMD